MIFLPKGKWWPNPFSNLVFRYSWELKPSKRHKIPKQQIFIRCGFFSTRSQWNCRREMTTLECCEEEFGKSSISKFTVLTKKIHYVKVKSNKKFHFLFLKQCVWKFWRSGNDIPYSWTCQTGNIKTQKHFFQVISLENATF